MSGVVHRWPLIVVTMTSHEALAVCGGKRSVVAVDEAGSVALAARDAALAVCEDLGKRRCRVEGITDDNQTYQMVVDVDEGTLVELHEAPGPSPGAGGVARTGSMAAAAGGIRRGRRWDPRTLTKRQAGYALTGLFVLAGVAVPVGAQVLGEDSSTEVVLPAPGPTQLPVAAPAGWSTYAKWSAPAQDRVPVRQDAAGRLVIVEGRDVVTRQAETGREVKRVAAPFEPTGLAVWTDNGTPRLAVSGGGGRLAVMDQDGEQFTEVQLPERAEVVLEGGEPLIVGADQTAGVLAGDSVQKRIVPAGAEAVAADGGAVIAADAQTGRLWKITEESPELPEPATVKAPKGMKVAAFPAGRGSLVVAQFAGEKSTGEVAVLEVTAGEGKTEVTQLVSEAVKGSTGTGQPQWDPAGALVSLGRVSVDFEAVMVTVLPESAQASAGHLWVTGTGDETSARLSRAGTALDAGDPKASVPVLITDGGLAVVEENGQVYAVTETAPTPASTPAGQASTEHDEQKTTDGDASTAPEDEEK